MAVVGVLPSENIIVVGGGAETAIETHRDQANSAVGVDSFEELADRFGAAAAGWAGPGDICSEALGPRVSSEIEAQFDEFRGNPFQALAFAYNVEGEGMTTGSIAMHYEDPADAEADLELRENALTEGNSLSLNQPYNQLLEVTEASVDDKDLVIAVAPVDDRLELDQMLIRRDLVFALC
jgi:hypothetical protein